jgi:hypothetical protein
VVLQNIAATPYLAPFWLSIPIVIFLAISFVVGRMLSKRKR